MSGKDTDNPPNRVLISSARKPITYMSPCKRILQEHGEVHLSALGIAISTCVTVAELLKSRGLAVEKSINTSLENLQDSEDQGSRQKPKMLVALVKSDNFEEVFAKEAKEDEARRAAKAAAAATDAPEETGA